MAAMTTRLIFFCLISAVRAGLVLPAAVADQASSPDRRLTATIERIGAGDQNGNGAEALVSIDLPNGKKREALLSKWSADYEQNQSNLSGPLFSLDGHYIYFSSSDESPNSAAVHQYSLKTNVVRFVHRGHFVW